MRRPRALRWIDMAKVGGKKVGAVALSRHDQTGLGRRQLRFRPGFAHFAGGAVPHGRGANTARSALPARRRPRPWRPLGRGRSGSGCAHALAELHRLVRRQSVRISLHISPRTCHAPSACPIPTVPESRSVSHIHNAWILNTRPGPVVPVRGWRPIAGFAHQRTKFPNRPTLPTLNRAACPAIAGAGAPEPLYLRRCANGGAAVDLSRIVETVEADALTDDALGARRSR